METCSLTRHTEVTSRRHTYPHKSTKKYTPRSNPRASLHRTNNSQHSFTTQPYTHFLYSVSAVSTMILTTVMMKETMQAAIDQNNHGVSSLQRGKHEEALKHFKGAAQLMYKVTQSVTASQIAATTAETTAETSSSSSSSLSNEQRQPQPPQSSECSSASSASAPPSCSCCVDTCQQSVRFCEAPCLLEGNSFICSCPIAMGRFDHNSERQKDCGGDDCCRCCCSCMMQQHNNNNTCTLESAIILFNMGLTYHLNFLKAAFSLEHALTNALTLYEMACNLGMQVSRSEGSSQIVMASLNNLGHLHHEVGDFGKSRIYLEELSNYIMSLENPTKREVAKERHEFMLNVMVLREPQGAPAA